MIVTDNRKVKLSSLKIGDVFKMESYIMMRVEQPIEDDEYEYVLCLTDGKFAVLHPESEVEKVSAELKIGD